MRASLLVGHWVVAAFLCAGVAVADDSNGRFGARTRDEFLASLATKAYEPAGGRAGRMVAGAAQVARCMKHTDVRKLMGEPTFGNTTHRSGDTGGKSAGAAWTYVLSTVRTPAQRYDRMITVWFDENGRVKSLNPRGVDDVLPLRANTQQKCS